MDKPQINITVPQADLKRPANTKPDPIEVVIREGAAELITEPQPVKFDGHLQAPADWMENRLGLGLLEPKNCHVETFEDDLKILFITDERSKYADVITGKLVRSKVIDAFKINTESTWTDKILAKFIRQHAFYFEGQDVKEKIYQALMKLETSVSRRMKNEADLNGNKQIAFQQEVSSNVPASFVMKAPLFNGYEDKIFEVFICADCTSVDVKFYLESPALFEMIEKEYRKLLSEQIERFKALGCAVIQK